MVTFDAWLPGSHPLYLVRHLLPLHSGAGAPSCGGQILDLPATSRQPIPSIVCGAGLTSHDDLCSFHGYLPEVPIYYVDRLWRRIIQVTTILCLIIGLLLKLTDYSMDYRTYVPSLTSQEGIGDQEKVLTKWHLWDFGLCWCVEVVHILVNLK